MKQMKIKPQCGTCKFADKRNGVGNWSCSSPMAYHAADKMPSNFPRIFANDSCKHWVSETPPAAPQESGAAAPAEG